MKFSKLSIYLLYTIVFIVALTPAAYAVDGCSSVSFKVAPTINLEASLLGLATADFNGDGHLDLVTVLNNGSGEVVLLSGRGGTERFDRPVSFSPGGPAQHVAAVDVNGDSKPDLVVTFDGFNQGIGKFAVLLNDGTGKFLAPNIIILPGEPFLPVFADLNNDGKLDIVTSLFTGNTEAKVAILLGNGSGGFTQAANSPITTFSVNPDETLVGDFNEDGKPDLAFPTSNGEGDVRILIGDGAGGFTFGGDTLTDGQGSTLTPGDFNKDGHLDLMIGNRMLPGTGTGSFGAPIVITIPESSNFTGIRDFTFTADVNNDGNLDVIGNAPSGLTIMLGNGTGNFTIAKSYTSGMNGPYGPAFAVLGDFNKDGKIDLAAAKLTGIGILVGDGTGAFHDAMSYKTDVDDPRNILVADFNNDGKKDLATLSRSINSFTAYGVEVALGDGAGGFTRRSTSYFGFVGLSSFAAADFNSDGKPDLAVTQYTAGRVTILINDGTGGFPQGSFTPSIFVGNDAPAIVSGDFNNDGKADLLVITLRNRSFSVMLGNGSGGFTIVSGIQLPGTVSGIGDVDIGDFNNDGNTDFAVVRSGSNAIDVLQGDGTGQFSTYATAPIPGLAVSVVVRDLNGDSKPDIAASSSSGSEAKNVTVLINNGAGGFNAAVNYPSGDAGGTIRVGDFNNDNHADLVLSSGFVEVSTNVDGVVVLTNKGNGEFNPWTTISAGHQSGGVTVVDINVDGKDDILFTQPLGAGIALLLNDFTTALPCLSISDATVTETDSGTINAAFTITLSSPSAQTVKVNYFTPPGLGLIPLPPFDLRPVATKGVDYEHVSDTVTFLPGETSRTINVPVKGDLIDEVDQFFVVALTTAVNASINDERAIGTILDNEATPAISVNDISVAEGTQTQSTATFTFSIDKASENSVVVQYTFQAGTATADVDYVAPSGLRSVVFDPGQTSTTVSVPITPDTTFEPDETFFINLGNSTNGTVVDAQGQATITNDDPQPTVSVAAQTFRQEGAQGTSGNASVEVRLSNPSFQTITVAFATANSSATAGSDYVTTSGTLTFNPGETLKSVSVQVNGDDVDEIDETFFVNLTNPTNAALGPAQGSVVILDDDGPALSVGDASITEGNIGFSNLTFTVTTSAPSVQDMFANFTVTSGTANVGVDVQAFGNSVFIPAGATSASIQVRVFGDFEIETDETFFVNLQSPTNATIADAQGLGTITNDDSNGKLQFSSATYSATEDSGGVVVTVNRVDGATGVVVVNFATSNGTATAGSDYPATSGTLTFNQGETSKSFFITFVSDSLFEGDETVNVALSNLIGGAVLGNPATAVLTIKTPPLFLMLEESALDPNQVTAVDSLWFTRDPFPVISTIDLFGQGLDKNTRVLVFVTNLQLAPNDVASTVRINLVDSGGQSHDLGAEDVRVVPLFNFTQIKFRLPDNLPPGVCNISIKAHDQESNGGTIRIKAP